MTGFILFTLCLLVLTPMAIVWGRRTNAARARALQTAATELGFHFAPGPFKRGTLPVPLPDLELFTRGTNDRFRNFMQGSYASARAMVFEYSYTRAHGGGTLRIVALEKGSPAVPSFSLQPEFHLGPLLNSPVVVGKVDFPARPEFTKRISVTRIEPAQAHAFFDEARAAFFLARWGVAAESKDGWLFVSREDQPVFANEKMDATALRGLLEQAREVREALHTGY